MKIKSILIMKKSILFFLFFIGLVNFINAQISSVKYLIEYNESSSLYDCKLIIEEGEATTFPQRIQYPGQYSVIVPTGAQMTVPVGNFPLQNNLDYGGTVPGKWQANSEDKAPPSQPQSDFYSIIPILSPVSAYNDLIAGDTITLFSISVDADPSDNAVRPFENGVDPSSLEMPSGGDYTNSFAIGGVEEIYNGNVSTWYCDGWEVTLPSHDICSGTCVELTPNMNCTSDDLIYAWSTGEDTPSITVCPDESTTYAVEITNPDMEVVVVSSEVLVSELIVEFTGDDRLCRGETTTVFPNMGGTWASNNVSVATIDVFTGLITAVGQGAVTFTFTSSSTGCTGTTSGLIVDPVPSVSSDMNAICFSSTATLAPSSGGTWEVMNPEVATLSDNIVSAVSVGEAGFRFTADATGCISDILYINVEDTPVTSLVGPNEVCVWGSATSMEPSTGGTWTSDDPAIATITNSGLITAVQEGCATFIFTSSTTLCSSEPSELVCVKAAPTVESPSNNFCINETYNLSPASGGTWISDNSLIATVNGLTGEVTALNNGTVRFTFTDEITGCTASTEMITVHPDPFQVLGAQEMCAGETGLINPSLDGTWISDNTEVLTIDMNSGAITAISEGIANIMFTDNNTSCSSTVEIKVNTKPMIALTGDNEMCPGTTTLVTPSSGGQWSSSDDSVLTVDDMGNVTAIVEGVVTIDFTDNNTGCVSDPIMISVIETQEAIITGAKEICIGGLSTAFPSSGGTWISNSPSIAGIDNAGNITGYSEGYASFVYSDGECLSTTESILVLASLSMDIDTIICEGMNYNGLDVTGIYTIDTIDSATGCDITITIDLEVLPLNDPLCTVGINELPESEVKIFPNPANGLVFVESESALEAISIYTIDYQKVEDVVFTNGVKKTQINTEKLVKGLYILAIESRGMLTYKKLIIE